MADIRLSEQDIDYISRVVATEVPASVRRNPMEYNRMVGAVVDTVTNRLASGRYGSSVKEVLNQNRAFSKITGPKRLAPYGSVEATPVAPKYVQTAVNDYVAARAKGKPSEIKGGTDYANPFHSDLSNLRKWVNPMIAKGAEKMGLGTAIHYHGTAPGSKPAPDYNLVTPAGFMPSIESDMRYQVGVPIPTPRQPMALMAQAKAADRTYNPGGIVGAKAISLNPVSSAQAGEMPKITRSPLPAIRNGWTPADQTDRWNAPIVPGNIDLNNRPIVKNSDGSISTVKSASFGIDGREVLLPTVSPSGVKLTDKGALSLYNATGKNLGQFRDANAANIYAQKLHEDQAAKYLPKTAAKTSTGVGYSLPKAQPTSQFAATPQRTQRALPNVASSAYSDARPMPTGTIPQRVSAPVQSTPAPRYNPLPSGPVAPSVSPQTMAAAYGQYAQTRMAAPSTPMQANPVTPRIQASGTAGTMIDAPITPPPVNNTFPAKPAAPTMKQKIKGTLQNVIAPENLKSMGGQLAGGAAGSLLGGPIGGILGGLIGKQIMSQPQGQGLLAGLFGGGNNGYQGQSTYIGNGVNAVDRAMYGNRAGDTATYNSQGGGTVTNLGNGISQRTSNKFGWTETTYADGSKSFKK